MSESWIKDTGSSPTSTLLVLDQFRQEKKHKESVTVSMPENTEQRSAIDSSSETWSDYALQYVNLYKDQIKNQKISALTQEIRELKNIVTQISKELLADDKPNVTQSKIYNLASSEYEVKIPIDVIVKIYKDEVISLIPDLELYGEGSNEMDSINNLKLELLDLFDDLNEMEDEELGETPKGWKKTLNLLIRKCQ